MFSPFRRDPQSLRPQSFPSQRFAELRQIFDKTRIAAFAASTFMLGLQVDSLFAFLGLSFRVFLDGDSQYHLSHSHVAKLIACEANIVGKCNQNDPGLGRHQTIAQAVRIGGEIRQ